MNSGDKPSRLTGYYTVGFSSAKNRTFYENWVNNLQLVIWDIKIQVIWKHAALQGEMASSAPGVHASKAQHALIRASTAWNCRFCSKIPFDLQMCNSYAIVYHSWNWCLAQDVRCTGVCEEIRRWAQVLYRSRSSSIGFLPRPRIKQFKFLSISTTPGG